MKYCGRLKRYLCSFGPLVIKSAAQLQLQAGTQHRSFVTNLKRALGTRTVISDLRVRPAVHRSTANPGVPLQDFISLGRQKTEGHE